MKLIYCRACYNVFKLESQPRYCECGQSGGQYLSDRLNAKYWGKWAVPLGFSNISLVDAVENQPEEGMGQIFEAFVIPKKCETMVKVDDPRSSE